MKRIDNMKRIKNEMIGKPINKLTTPVIVADYDILLSNLSKMDAYFDKSNCRLRPHFKSHKCVALAKLQMEFKNTVGITCAKLSEAEQLVTGGIKDVLIANQAIGMDKTVRIAEMNLNAVVRVAVDSTLGIEQLSAAALKVGVDIGVFVEVNIGMNRGGVQPGRPVLTLVDIISKTPGVHFDGIQSYEGHIVTLKDYDERKRRVEQDLKPVIETKKLLELKGYKTIISSGGTGTYDITGNIEGVDELQCGSYALMDTFYKKVRPEFEYARFVFVTINSVEMGKTVNVGLKGVGAEYGSPEVLGYPEAIAIEFSEEHLVLHNLNAELGEKIRLVPPHGCTTNNLYSKMWIVRNDKIVDVWAIEARGCLE